MNIDDLLILSILLWLLLISVYIYYKLKNKEYKNMSEIERANKDRIDLEKITRNIETDYKPINISLTSYEQEQENNAIISYEELLSKRNSGEISYEDTYQNEDGINVKKIDIVKDNNCNDIKPKMEFTLMSYEKEEEFLKALKQLQRDLVS